MLLADSVSTVLSVALPILLGGAITFFLDRRQKAAVARLNEAQAAQAIQGLGQDAQEDEFTWYERWKEMVAEVRTMEQNHEIELTALQSGHEMALAELRAVVAKQAIEIQDLQRRVNDLEDQVESLGHTPVTRRNR